ncbi:MAG: DUF3795 domain-containing protein [Methanomicrobiales archaeon]|nr:DUF3795 domain-containing protein [Methanomicrobiales archaeon]
MDPDLIAPCGMDCGICSAYLACAEGIPRKIATHCAGCRARNKKCAYLKGQCPGLRENNPRFCFECREFPCKRLQSLDRRYRFRYDMSMIDNLRMIQEKGMDAFLASQEEKYRCPHCGALISVHNGKCYRCTPPADR